uniref:Uncharacterized protein n=1 Tax=Anguilla anguilla TaxID=7936 RepID=A0A0E9QFW9_ANGAN
MMGTSFVCSWVKSERFYFIFKSLKGHGTR